MAKFFYFSEMRPDEAIDFSRLPMQPEQSAHLRELAGLVEADPNPDAYAYCRVVVGEHDGFRIRISKDAPPRDNPFN